MIPFEVKNTHDQFRDLGIPFTQYLRPHGTPRMQYIRRPDSIVEMAKELLSEGFYFDIEELNCGTISMTVMKKGWEETVSIRLSSNGPEVPVRVDDLIQDAHQKMKSGWTPEDRE